MRRNGKVLDSKGKALGSCDGNSKGKAWTGCDRNGKGIEWHCIAMEKDSGAEQRHWEAM